DDDDDDADAEKAIENNLQDIPMSKEMVEGRADSKTEQSNTS
ncbi:hypothetical protein A2U01_0090712, partial [Trifolium medium]|nr:hypothetical protein [Trifolium medium]